MKKRILSALLVVALFLTAFANVSAADRNSLDNFQKQASYTAGQFADVAPGAWYEDNVKSAYELGLMVGTSGTAFDPEGQLSIAQAVTIAARLHNVYAGNGETFAPGTPWYQVYMDYAAIHGMLVPADYPDPEALATRAEYAAILSAAFPDEALTPLNTVNAIPDVPADADYAPAVLRLYRAGILKGNDESGNFAPDRGINRAEVAAMVTRMADPALRLRFTLPGQETGDTVTVTFDWNYGGKAPQTVEVPIGQPVPEPEQPTRTLFRFDGWFNPMNGFVKYDFSAPVYEDITLYAHWSTVVKDAGKEPEPLPSPEPSEEPVIYTVTFDSNGGSAVNAQLVPDGGTVTEPDAPSMEGAFFVGWYLDSDLTEAYDFSSIVMNNLTLYAKWSDSEYTVEYQQLLERKQEELNHITELNNGITPEIVLDDEDIIPSFILGQYSETIVTDYDSAIASLRDIEYLMEFSDLEQEFANTEADGSSYFEFENTRYYYLQQMYQGYPVYGKQLLVVTDENGQVKTLSGDYDPLKGIMDERILITEEQAIVSAESQGFPGLQNGKLVVYSLIAGFNEFAWCFDGIMTVFVSAVSGEILDSWTNINTAQTPTIGRGENDNGVTVAFNTVLDDKGTADLDDDEYIFYDSIRDVYYKDLNNNDSDNLFQSSNQSASYQNLYDDDNIWSSSKAITLQENLSKVYDYYLETIGLMSYDGNGGTVYAFVNDMYDSGENAFNWGPFAGGTMLAFGGVANYHRQLDVVGHEFTHAVQGNRVTYAGEGGALMEAYSDLGGELAQLYTTGTADWVHGSRNMSNPGANNNPSKYEGANWLSTATNSGDNGHVHNNSTVISHAVYTIFQSGLNDVSEMTELLFRTWHYLTFTSDFLAYRMAMCAAANDMGLSLAKKQSITTAFDSANIKPESYGQFLSLLFARNLVVFTVEDSRGQSIPSANISIRKNDGTTVAALYTNGYGLCSLYMYNGDYSVIVDATGYTLQTFSLHLDAGFSLNLLDIETVYVTYQLPDDNDQPDEIKCAVGGHIENAITKESVEGVRLRFRKGYQVTSGPIARTVYTDASGHFYLENLDYGYYTVEMQKEGYITSYQVVQGAATNWSDSERQDALNQNWTISPYLTTEDTIRIVLTWGENPHDLDSHITGTLSDGNPFHVYFGDESASDPDGSLVALLDVDDVTSYGPETVTLHWREGVRYSYYVHLFSGAGTLSTSEAKLQIYSGSSLISTVRVPSGSGSTRIWNVFTFQDGIISMVNSFSDVPINE